jgi:hypothetical protein
MPNFSEFTGNTHPKRWKISEAKRKQRTHKILMKGEHKAVKLQKGGSLPKELEWSLGSKAHKGSGPIFD